MKDSNRAPPENVDSEWAPEGSIEQSDASAQHGEVDTYRASFDADVDSAPMVAILTVAAVSNTPAVELPPLGSVIDTDALDTLFQSESVVDITFTYYGYTVTVHSDGGIEISKYNK